MDAGRESVPSKNGKKMQTLPKSAKVTKRPLLHPPTSSRYKSRDSQKVVYLGTKTPFISAFKRVKSLLKEVDKRSMQSELQKSKQRRYPTAQPQTQQDDEGPATEEVIVKATGKAIEKALGLALFFQKQADLNVKIRTDSTHAIDDIETNADEISRTNLDEELPESRLRAVSILEIAVSLRGSG